MPAAVQRNTIAAFRHRFTLRQTRRTVPIMFSVDFVAVKVQTEPSSKRQRKAFGLSIPKLHGTPLSVPTPFAPAPSGRRELAWEGTYDATEYRAMAAEHHRLAGMCRSPESREQHFRLEQELPALAEREEVLQGTRTLHHASDPQTVK
jgi:hypothetical protein